MSSEKHREHPLFGWITRKWLIATLLFLAIALFMEYLVVRLFISFGLSDAYLFTDLPFMWSVSPLFHLLPLGVILVLALSWGYLANYMPVMLDKTTPQKKLLTRSKRQRLRARKMRFRSTRRLFRRIDTEFGRLSRPVRSFFRLHLAKATIKSAITIFGVFLISVLALFALGYPSFVHEVIAGFYRANPSFHGFVLGTFETTQGIGETVAPLGWLGSVVNSALLAIAPGFRAGLEGFGVSITGPLVELDFVWKYAICQNIAALASALIALVYRRKSYPYRRFKKR